MFFCLDMMFNVTVVRTKIYGPSFKPRQQVEDVLARNRNGVSRMTNVLLQCRFLIIIS